METPNLNYIKELSGGDEAFEKEIINIVKEEFPQEKEVYFKSVDSGNFEAMVEIVHKLKHKISIFGLTKAYEVAVNYEKNLKEGTKELKEDFEEVLKLITSYLETI